jgi:hypothetical protein
MVPQHQCFAHYCSSAVEAVQNEETGSWGAKFVVVAFEILGPQLAFLVGHSAAQGGIQVLMTKNQHGT